MREDFEMGGSTGDGEYLVVACTDLARIGYRRIPGGFRVRVEPDEAAIPAMRESFSGWTMPTSSNPRFSLAITSYFAFEEAIIKGLTAIRGRRLVINPEAPDWARASAAKFAAPKPDEREVFMRASSELLRQFKRHLR